MIVTVFSDASQCIDCKVAGWGAWIKRDGRTLRAGGPMRANVSDSVIAEAMAVVNALHAGVSRGFILPRDDVLVQTDNDAVEQILLGRAKRKARPSVKRRRNVSWRVLKDECRMKNDEIRLVADAFARLQAEGGFVFRWRHVKGHRMTEDRRAAVNSYCDKVARRNMKIARTMPHAVKPVRQAA